MIQVNYDVSEIEQKHEEHVRNMEQTDCEKLFNEGANATELPSKRREHDNQEPINF